MIVTEVPGNRRGRHFVGDGRDARAGPFDRGIRGIEAPCLACAAEEMSGNTGMAGLDQIILREDVVWLGLVGHELTHLFIRAFEPQWLVEGVAHFFQLYLTGNFDGLYRWALEYREEHGRGCQATRTAIRARRILIWSDLYGPTGSAMSSMSSASSKVWALRREDPTWILEAASRSRGSAKMPATSSRPTCHRKFGPASSLPGACAAASRLRLRARLLAPMQEPRAVPSRPRHWPAMPP